MRRAYKWDEDGRVYEVEETWHKGESLGGVVIRHDFDVEAEYDATSMETLAAALAALREERPPIDGAVVSYVWADGDESVTSNGNGGAILVSWHGDEVVLSRQGVENVLAAIALLYPPEPAEPEWREWTVGDPAPDAKYVAVMLRSAGIEYRYVDEPYWGECGDKTITHWRPLDVPEVPE